MKLETGKYYKTRNGEKVECVATWVKPTNLLIQAACIDTERNLRVYTTDGRTIAGSNYDILEECEEPVHVEGWVNVYKKEDGDYWFSRVYTDKRVALRSRASRYVETIFVRGQNDG